MKLQEAVQSGHAIKHVDAPIAGTHTVDQANLSAGYYADFQPDDPARRSSVSTSFYWGPRKLPSIASYAGEDGWTNREGNQ